MTIMDSAPTQGKRSWGWVVVVGLVLLLVGGGFGMYAVSNGVAASRYADSSGAVGSLSIPRLEKDGVPIVSGTTLEALRQGVGWYEGTAAPGEIGNFALTGHRLGWGQPFADLGSLEVGDEVRVSVGEDTYVYHVITSPTVIYGEDTNVLAPVPGDPTLIPTKALLTLTTAADLLPSPNRLVVVAELADE